MLIPTPSLKPQIACNADLEARWLGQTLEKQEPRKKPREEPGSEGWLVLFWLWRL